MLRHACFQGSKDATKDVASGFAGQSHQFDFVHGLCAAASDGEGIGGSKLKSRRCLAQVIVESEHCRFFHGDATGADAALRESGSGESCGAFIFLPYADFGWEAQLFAKTAFFKGRTHDKWLAFSRNEDAEQPLAGPPTNTREIVKRGARSDEQRVKLWALLGKKLLRTGDARSVFVGDDRPYTAAEGL